MTGATAESQAPRPLDRRARRRQETIEEILDIAQDVMAEEGVNGLSLAEVARRLGGRPPSIFKHFPSLMVVYAAIFPLRPAAMADAAAAGHLGPGADSDEAVCLVSILIVGVLSQALANEPDLECG